MRRLSLFLRRPSRPSRSPTPHPLSLFLAATSSSSPSLRPRRPRSHLSVLPLPLSFVSAQSRARVWVCAAARCFSPTTRLPLSLPPPGGPAASRVITPRYREFLRRVSSRRDATRRSGCCPGHKSEITRRFDWALWRCESRRYVISIAELNASPLSFISSRGRSAAGTNVPFAQLFHPWIIQDGTFDKPSS